MILSKEQFSVVFKLAADIIEQSIIDGRTEVSCYTLDNAVYNLLNVYFYEANRPMRDFYAKYMKPSHKTINERWFGLSNSKFETVGSIRQNQKRRQTALLLMHEMVNSNLDVYYSEYLR